MMPEVNNPGCQLFAPVRLKQTDIKRHVCMSSLDFSINRIFSDPPGFEPQLRIVRQLRKRYENT